MALGGLKMASLDTKIRSLPPTVQEVTWAPYRYTSAVACTCDHREHGLDALPHWQDDVQPWCTKNMRVTCSCACQRRLEYSMVILLSFLHNKSQGMMSRAADAMLSRPKDTAAPPLPPWH